MVSETLPYLLKATAVTMKLAVASIVLSAAIGLTGGLLSHLGGRIVRTLLSGYVFIVRGTPLLVQVFLVYFGLPFFGVHINPYGVAFLAISAHMGALGIEIIRGSIATIPRGQTDAGRALGLRDWETLWEIVLPQAVRSALPPYISLLPITIKATALASVISIWELTLASKEIIQRTIDPFGTFGVAMVIYFLLCYPLTYLSTLVERRITAYRI